MKWPAGNKVHNQRRGSVAILKKVVGYKIETEGFKNIFKSDAGLTTHQY